MKRIIGLIVFSLFLGNAFAQDISQKNVPAVVLNAFKIKFPNATDIDWRLEKGNYRIKFEVNNKDNELFLDDRGNILKHHQDLYGSEVPENVRKTIKSKVALFDLDDADLFEEGGKTVYEINFEISGKDHDFWIDEKGKIIKYRKELKDNEIPTNIVTEIKNKYGILDIDRAEYNEENGKIIYYQKGEINDKDHEFIFDNKTNLLLHKQDLRDSEIPTPVINSIKTNYREYEIRDADLREENGKITYDLRLRKSKENIHVIFNPKGEILKVIKN
jgi:uncharacterized membrane protein YkoI